jgi:putative ABC transport system permease protein
MAKTHWPDGDAIGRRFRVAGIGSADDWFTIVGILPDANLYGVQPGNEQPPVVAFVPHAYQQTLNTGLTIRVAGDPSSITSAARAQIRESDPNLPLAQVRTMEDARRLTFWQYGLYGWVFGTIGVVGLLLASVGVYGVLAFSVSQRTQEMGVRIALGAGARDLLRLVVGHGLLLGGIGIAIGLALAPVLTWFARTLLFRVSAFDPVSFTMVATLLLVVAFLASYLPARRAMRVDPVIALRGE